LFFQEFMMAASQVMGFYHRIATSWLKRFGVLALGAVLVAGSFTFASNDAEARRMGGGRSFGRQSPSVMHQQAAPAPTAPPRAQAAPAAAPRAATPQPARSRWLGPLAGIAAGLGIAALLSHFGLGGAFAGMMANVIVIALLAFIVIALFRWFARRRAANNGMPAYAQAGAGQEPGSTAWQREGQSDGLSSAAARASGASGVSPGFSAAPGVYEAPQSSAPAMPAGPIGVPADFDTAAFLRNAKVYFVRMQAAWDAGDLKDIREFTTPEMFAEVKLDLDERGATPNRTDVVQLEAELLGIEQPPDEYLASVRFHGLMREAEGAAAEPFSEVWNLAKSRQQGGWLLAGIQQVN
jgi:predicted lipid-binding transport protein (Tim44 family)